MFKFIHALIISSVLSFGPYAAAAVSPIAVSVLAPVQFPPSDFTITGARVSLLWGSQRDVYGLDLGLIGNTTQQTFVGIGLAGVFNTTHGTTTILALQGAGVANVNTNKTNVVGLQIAGLVNMNQAVSSVIGIQGALAANLAPHTTIYGAQVGLYNTAQDVYGFQIGLVNVAKSLHGIQIGLLNFNSTGLFAVSPIINIGF